jgi:nicotinamidase-related amidase
MLTIDPRKSFLLIVDFQARLMPVIHQGGAAIRNARRLLDAAALLDVPRLFTEQNPKGLGTTVPELPINQAPTVEKQSFDACREHGFLDRIPAGSLVVVAGCEAHVCVQQTVLGLLSASRRAFVVSDAIGSRDPANREAAVRRMERHGAEIVTTEMVVFEWLQTADHPKFREVVALIK